MTWQNVKPQLYKVMVAVVCTSCYVIRVLLSLYRVLRVRFGGQKESCSVYSELLFIKHLARVYPNTGQRTGLVPSQSPSVGKIGAASLLRFPISTIITIFSATNGMKVFSMTAPFCLPTKSLKHYFSFKSESYAFTVEREAGAITPSPLKASTCS